MSLGAGSVGLQLHAFCSFSLAFASVLKCSLFLNKLVYDYNLDHWVRLLAISHLATSFLATSQFFDILSLLRHAMRQKHLLTFSFLLWSYPPSALALALLFWQTPEFCEFAQLN